MNGFQSGMTQRGPKVSQVSARSGDRVLAQILAVVPVALRPLLTGTLMRYVGASVVALSADTASFLFLLHCSIPAALAAAIGFMIGTGVHWLVSSRVMFVTGVASHGPERRAQIVLFTGSALVGLALTTWIVSAAVAFAINPRLGKLVAIGVSFIVTSALRHVLIFGKARLVQ